MPVIARGHLIVPLLLGCAAPHSSPDPTRDQAARAAIRATLDSYTAAARRVDAADVARHYTTAATLFEPGIFPIHTRDSIRAFMGSFPGVRVDSAIAIADTIDIFGATAMLWGTYFERLSFPGQPTSEQDGKFVMEWHQQPDGAWLIHRYYRVPLPASSVPPTTP